MIGIHEMKGMSAMTDISKTELYYSLHVSGLNRMSRIRLNTRKRRWKDITNLCLGSKINEYCV